MSLKERIDQDIRAAMKSKNQAALRALRAVKSAILLAETAEGRSEGPLTAAEEMKLLSKQVKQRKDSYEQYQQSGREDLAEKEKEEYEIIENYLPKQLSAEEVEQELKPLVHDLGASSMKDMGKVMGVATKQLAGKADGKLISQVVKKLLSQ